MVKKILIFSSKLHRGGAEMHMVKLCNQLVNNNYQIDIVVTQGKGGYEDFLDKRISVHYPEAHKKSYTLALFLSLFHLKKMVKALQPDVVISIQDGPNVVNLLQQKYSKEKIKRVIIVQNNPEKLKNTYPGKLVYYFSKKMYATTDAFVALSEGVAKACQGFLKNYNGKVAVIPNIGNLSDQVSYKPKQLSPEKLNLLAVGRLEEQKDYPTMFKALAEVKAKLGHKHIELKILGNGAKEKALQKLAKELGIEENVNFVGFVSDTSVYYAKADIFLLSSKWEGFGNVIVEAMSYGLPVISTNCPFGPSEIINHLKDGFLTEVEDHHTFANNIIQLADNPALYEEMSESAFKNSKRFSNTEISKKYMQIIDNA